MNTNLQSIKLTRTFGLEIEFANANKDDLKLPNDYQYTKNKFTVLHNTDCTLIKNNGKVGGEINSKPISFNNIKDMRELRQLFNSIWKSQGELQWYIPLHIHFYIKDLSIEEIKKINDGIYLLHKHLKKIFSFAPWTDNKYADPPLPYDVYKKIDKAGNIDDIAKSFKNNSNRGFLRPYISFAQIVSIGTMEYRFFAGTKKFRTVLEFIKFCYKFVDYCICSTKEEKESITTEDLIKKLNIKEKHIVKPISPFIYAGEETEMTTNIGEMFKKSRPLLSKLKKSVGKNKVLIHNSFNFDIEQCLLENEKKIYTDNNYVFLLYDIILKDLCIKMPVGFEWIDESTKDDSKEMRLSKLALFFEMEKISKSKNYFAIRKYENTIQNSKEILEKMCIKYNKVLSNLQKIDCVEYKSFNEMVADQKENEFIIYHLQETAQMKSLHNKCAKYFSYSYDRIKNDFSKITHFKNYCFISKNKYLPYNMVYSGNREFLYSDTKVDTYKAITVRKITPLYYTEIPNDYDITQKSKMKFIRAKQSEVDFLRQKYLAKNITLGGAKFAYLWFVDDFLIGACMLDFPKRELENATAWLKSDFVVDSNVYRLSKLLIMGILSDEFSREINIRYKDSIKLLVTNVFTEKPVSMKYRGVFDLRARESTKLVYVGVCKKYGTLNQVIKKYTTQKDKK